ncbi:tRNA (adenosine(37)-N6)-threonylcarbamoyltransferase complex dimerization subunit type 1 TsaB [Weeksella virosa]|uniref:Universal protein YeaZ n=2 Tax=Weeksella virosa TaxID=1014 RepID=F0NXK4_WEEVC|nr:tRNA (adenosine(37)-N6)-threonylcarbamoyltransferase complex dimerization subunit type 1 TsaB [Weeksella virosa]ADX67994.1 universal protein YeaZ [Weeksella virosa DSM 16922]VEH64372.1 UGMP family protein [Weeksella virosa]
MALLLQIETSTKNCSVALSKDGHTIASIDENSDGYVHGEKLHQFIQWAIEGTPYTLQEIDGVCVSKGPGSYTGLRIGVSAAKGLAFSLGVPLISINSLQVLANAFQGADCDLIIPMIDARRMEVYTAIFSSDAKALTPTEAKIIDEDSFRDLSNKKLLLIGDGAMKTKEILQTLNADFVEAFPTAKAMSKMAAEKFNRQEFEDVAYFEPFYLKDFVAGKKKE